MNTVIFDLDGTLLPMDQDLFLQKYFALLAKTLSPYGFEPKALIDSVWAGTKAMIENNGNVSNEEKFWQTFLNIHGEESRSSISRFEEFYANEFNTLREFTMPTPMAAKCVREIKARGYTLVLATNPLFPRIATHFRISWAGLDPLDFSYITTYENSSFSKPNLNYYRQILETIQKSPEECLMIGNDLKEDMCISELGADTFLITECLLNEDKDMMKKYKQGNYDELYEYIVQLPKIG